VLGTEWGPYGVRVVGLIPGWIEDTVGFEKLANSAGANNKDGAKAKDMGGDALNTMKSIVPR